ncbi:macromomycin [Streptomyces bambusae]|uniref:enediyne antibiotic chromoprotein n=1 Tax=Streptomyces bambusae TaxID=1550616 RepID=UPI001CFD799E|nr:enediyne antibiotic chromoprotein [Streptomyces bambusae]MCB5165658.1 macromomycin [Streptomyces bambusae]
MLKNKTRFLARAGATTAMAAGLAFAFGPSAMAAPGVTVTPGTGLTDGQTITVSATGLTPGTVYHVGQCAVVEPGTIGCNAATAVNVTADAAGKATAQLKVNTSFQAVVGANGTPWGTVNCKVVSCSAGLGDATGAGAAQVITFA